MKLIPYNADLGGPVCVKGSQVRGADSGISLIENTTKKLKVGWLHLPP